MKRMSFSLLRNDSMIPLMPSPGKPNTVSTFQSIIVSIKTSAAVVAMTRTPAMKSKDKYPFFIGQDPCHALQKNHARPLLCRSLWGKKTELYQESGRWPGGYPGRAVAFVANVKPSKSHN